MNASGPIGAFVGPIVGGAIVDAPGLGFSGLVLVDGALLLTVIVALSGGYRAAFVPTDTRPLLRMALDSVRVVWRSPMLPLFPALFLLFTGWMLANTFVPIAIASLYHGGDRATAIGLVLGGGGFATLVIAPIMGALADRLGRWRGVIPGAPPGAPLWPLPRWAARFAPVATAWS